MALALEDTGREIAKHSHGSFFFNSKHLVYILDVMYACVYVNVHEFISKNVLLVQVGTYKVGTKLLYWYVVRVGKQVFF